MSLAEPIDAPGPARAATAPIDIGVVGGGAAGLATAILAARGLAGARVVVFEGARRIGAKILVSGGGRCNVTNRDVRAADYSGGDRRFIESVLRAFPSGKAAAWFEELGVRLHEEESGKIFPDTGRSRTVLDALLAAARRCGVEIRLGQRVEAVRAEGGVLTIRLGGESVDARRVVLATGGLSLPKSGSDGGGLRLAASLGHRIVPTTPALAPLVLHGTFHRSLAGVSHEASLSIHAAGSPPVHVRGSLLWTHFGLSGPAALDASRHWHRAVLDGREADVRLSFLPGSDFPDVERRLCDASAARPAATLRGTLSDWLPAAVATGILESAGIDPGIRLAHLPRADRRRLVHALVAWDLPVAGSRGYNYAEATAGGVSLEEVDRGSMRSKKCPGLYLVGEMLDVDGRLGGFNFQWAWSSAWVAARDVARSLQGEGRDA